MKTPHKHAVYIKAWADGENVQVQLQDGRWDTVGQHPSWYESNTYRIKPQSHTVTIEDGIATLEDGSTVNLLAIQYGFVDTSPLYRQVQRLTGFASVDGNWVPVQKESLKL